MNDSEFAAALEGLGIVVAEGLVTSFDAFEKDLYAQNQVMNLTRVDRADCRVRHFLDSLLIAPLIPQDADVLDLGTGPGFPAWPLAVTRPDLRVTALDSSGKMLGFLRRHPLPNIEVVQERAEDWPVEERFDVVTGRALAPLAAQLEISVRPCRVGGRVIPLRTHADMEAATHLATAVIGLRRAKILRMPLPGSDAVRVLPIYEKVRRTPKGYPRPWARIKADPIGSGG